MTALALAKEGVASDTKAPQVDSAPQRVGLSEYRRGFALLRRFYGGPKPFVLGAVLLLVEAGSAVVHNGTPLNGAPSGKPLPTADGRRP